MHHPVGVQLLNRVSSCLLPHGLQHARLLCPSLSPGLCSNSCPLNQGCHPTILPSAAPFSFGLFQSFPASGSFPMTLHIRWPKYSSFSISPSNEYSGSIPLGLTAWISLLSKGLSRVLASTTSQKHEFFGTQPSSWFNSQICT